LCCVVELGFTPAELEELLCLTLAELEELVCFFACPGLDLTLAEPWELDCVLPT
jgi:hypothetical protein